MIKTEDLERIREQVDWSGYDRDDSRGIIKMLLRHIEEVEVCDQTNRTIRADKAWQLLHAAREAMLKVYNLEESAEYLEVILARISENQLDEWWSECI